MRHQSSRQQKTVKSRKVPQEKKSIPSTSHLSEVGSVRVRNCARRERQKERKLKREEKLGKKMRYRKKRAKEAYQNSGGKKKKRGLAGVRMKCLGGKIKLVKSLLNESPKATCWSYMCRSIVHLPYW